MSALLHDAQLTSDHKLRMATQRDVNGQKIADWLLEQRLVESCEAVRVPYVQSATMAALTPSLSH